MNWRLKLIQIHCPGWIKNKNLMELFDLTAAAFEKERPDVSGLAFYERLRRYAQFTKISAEHAIRYSDDLKIIRERLYQRALQFGGKLRDQLHLRTMNEALQACQVLYGAIGIDFQGDDGGEIRIPRCFFSQYYSGQVCQLIAALDEGVVAGLSGGGQLIFYQRLTEGCDCCKAILTTEVSRA